jgi:hypothetical protein
MMITEKDIVEIFNARGLENKIIVYYLETYNPKVAKSLAESYIGGIAHAIMDKIKEEDCSSCDEYRRARDLKPIH